MRRIRSEDFVAGGKTFQVAGYAVGDGLDRVVRAERDGKIIGPTYFAKWETAIDLERHLGENAVESLITAARDGIQNLPLEVLEKL
jgi:hypothetical protein